jgi:transcription elongation GreA/GreB family factor
MVTAYDTPSARLVDEAGVDAVLVGDSLGMTVLGFDSTLPVTLDDMVRHTAAVVRGVRHALVVADMPFLTFQVNAEEAIRNAGRLVAEGGAAAVKIEGGASVAPTAGRIVESGIPVMGHVGLTPQSVHALGGYKVQAKESAAALRLIEDEVAGRAGGPPGDIWRVLWSALALIENRPKPSLATKILGWLQPGGVFERLLEARPCPEDIQLKVRVLFRTWRSSDRFLFPALDALERLGLAGEVQAIRAERQERSEKLFEGVGQQAEGAELPVMTRATWERLNQELERLERELRTTIPQAIQKARELGDLKENAEYHSAKLKQANVSRLVASLQLRLARARFVDEVEFKDGVVGLGTEVVLESAEQELRMFWILGEDEHHHGENVVSFQAPVGRALVGRAIGDEVELGEGADRRRWHIVSVERKLPTASE